MKIISIRRLRRRFSSLLLKHLLPYRCQGRDISWDLNLEARRHESFSHRASEAKHNKWNHRSRFENTSIVDGISSPSAHIAHPLGENSCKPSDSKRQLINNVETIRGGLHPTVVLTAGAVILLLVLPNDDCLPAVNEV